MAFNIIAETNKKLDFKRIHKELYSDDFHFEFFPMPSQGIEGGDAIGIGIPLKNISEETWKQLKPVLKKLKSKFNCEVYDLFGGQKLGLFNIDTFKNNLYQK